MRMQALGLCRFPLPVQGGLQIVAGDAQARMGRHSEPLTMRKGQRRRTVGMVKPFAHDTDGGVGIQADRALSRQHPVAVGNANARVSIDWSRAQPTSVPAPRPARAGRLRLPAQDADSGDPPVA
ncbi:hypothetical protein [Paracoccus haeundaensis]|uniref:Uncharacterized protein n=1 Tax=Paracoccus haeundaensis TaxID=225362 RepID=A0A5C4R1X9_9RHOB|nr:hypothetical protein [Paracoccus haeundaensis]TNH37926.1 hypothetical protein FHD67_17565 [Paracoccus haeundaensis]